MKRIASIMILLALCSVARGQVAFNGSNQKATYSYSCASVPCTMMAHIRLTNTVAGNSIFWKLPEGSGGDYIMLRVEDKRLRTAHSHASGNYRGFETGQIIEPNINYHVAASWTTATNATLHLNGTNVPATSWVSAGTPIAYSITGMSIGYQYAAAPRWLGGAVLDARHYTRALSASEIMLISKLTWELCTDEHMPLRGMIEKNDTGTALTGVALNLGTGANGTYSNSPTVAQPHVQTEKPMTMELP